MKKLLISASLFCGALIFGQNKFLSADYWKQKPLVQQVQADLAAGNDAAALNSGQFDAVTLAINNDAPYETIIFLLTQPGNALNKRTHDERTYLHWAASKDNAQLVEYLLKNGADLSVEDSGGRTPFQFGLVGNMKAETMQKFFNKGISPKYTDENGANLILLSAAKDNENLSLTRFLIAKGVDAKSKDRYGRTVADYAARMGNRKALDALLAAGYQYTDQALLMAAMGGRSLNDLAFFTYLVEKLNIAPDAVDATGKNVLHYLAGREKSEPIVTYFLQKGVSPLKVDKDGANVLWYAARNRNADNLKMMLNSNTASTLNTGNKDSNYPLMVAAQYSTPEVFSLIMQAGAQSTLKDRKGRNLMYYLVEGYSTRRPESVEEIGQKMNILRTSGYDFSTKDEAGNTLLHYVADKNSLKLMALALQYNPQPNVQNNEGESPLMVAAMVAPNDEILKMLLAAGADKSLKNSMGETAFQLADQNELLLKNGTDINFLQ